MANFLAQFQSIKGNCHHVVISVEDVSDLWPVVKNEFEQHLPIRKAYFNNKTRNAVLVEELPAEFILTTDARLRSRFSQEQTLFWFREPYATVILVTCEDLDEFKTILKPRLRLIIQNDEREWFIVFVSKAHPNNENATKLARKVYAKLVVDFNSKKRERCCKVELHGPEANHWEDLEFKIVECIGNTLDRRIQFYEDEIRKLTEQRFLPVWNFCSFFILKESLAFMFAVAHLYEDSLREYDELELCYLETVKAGKQREFGGVEHGDDQAALLDPGKKPLTQIIQDDTFREFEFRQYLFACQSKLIFQLRRPFEVAARGYSFIISFSKSLSRHEHSLPFCMREVWVISACLGLVSATTSRYEDGLLVPDIEKEFYRVQGDLYSLCRNKFMRLAYLIGYGMDIEKSPANSASLSMLSWPKPAVWPSIPSDASSEVLLKEKMVVQEVSKAKYFGIHRKPLPLEPSVLLREANRRRASLSAGNISEILSSSVGEIHHNLPPTTKEHSPVMLRSSSSPGFGSLDRPMTLAEIHVAAEHALKETISDPDLWQTLSSLNMYEEKYLALTRGAADNYHRSWWKRHGVVLDGEIAVICYKHGNIDQAAKSYEKVCALYAGEGWQELLADVLPNLAECQKILNDQAGYLSSCVRLLSLDKSLFSAKEFQAFQAEVVRLAHSEMEQPVPLDVSSLLTFSGNPSPPVELSDGDPGTIGAAVWSGFPDDIALESLSLSLISTHNADDGVKALGSAEVTILKPGKNLTTLTVPPQKPGSYVLGVLTGQIGHLRFRSHSFSKGGPADTDDFMSYEKPVKPILKVFKPRSLVDITAAVSSALLMNEVQWLGIIMRPINYSLKGAVLCIDTGPGLRIIESQCVEVERHAKIFQVPDMIDELEICEEKKLSVLERPEKLTFEAGKLVLPDWASNIASVIWIPVRATNEKLVRSMPSVSPHTQSVVDGMRTIALKLDFGISHTQTFERTLAVHFTEPFHVSTCVADNNLGMLLLQVILQSQVSATLTLFDAWIDLEEGFVHAKSRNGRPMWSSFPLEISPTSKAGIFFDICLGNTNVEPIELPSESVLHIKYGITGNRAYGAHAPENIDPEGNKDIIFRSALILQRPVVDPFISVGFLPSSTAGLRVGQLVPMKWRVERLKDLEENATDNNILYEVRASCETWMVAGRKRGRVSLSAKKGSRMEMSILCLPLVAGYVRPPQLVLPDVDEANVTCSPAGPHLVSVMPPTLCTSFYIPVA